MKEVTINEGRIRYRDEGRGPVLVFLHGALINASTWRLVTASLSNNYRCIAPDLPLGGHGLPLDAGADLSPPGIAAIIDQLLNALSLSEVTLIGNDTGGAYAQVYAAAHPQRVARLVLSNCDSLDVFPPKHFASLQASVRIPGYLAVAGLLFRIKPLLKSSLVLGLLSHRLGGDDIFRLYMHNFVSSNGVRRDFRKVVLGWSPAHTQSAARALAHFDKPVLLIWGADDQVLFPLALGERLAAIFPKAELAVVGDSLTYVQEDQPEAFVGHLLRFLASPA